MNPPRILIIAGPNGAGKTTFAREFLPFDADCPTFVNADLIAAGLSPFAPDKAAVRAGKLMLELIDERVGRRESFALETTLSGRSYARHIPQWRGAGFRVELFFLSLADPGISEMRVAQRVAQGGHDIPRDVIHRRFAAGLLNFDSVYKPLVDEWTLFDNSGAQRELIDCWRRPDAGEARSAREPEPKFRALPADATRDQKASYAALLRAGQRARELARQTGTDLIIWRDGKIVRIKPGDTPS